MKEKNHGPWAKLAAKTQGYIGQIVGIKPGRRSSNDIMLSNLNSVEILSISERYWEKPRVKVRVMNGTCHSRWDTRNKSTKNNNSIIHIYCDVLNLGNDSETYEIY